MAKKEAKPKEVKRVLFGGVDFETPVKPEKKAPKKSVPTLKGLLAEAKELGLKGYSKLNKTKLGEIISEAREKSSKKGK